MSFELPSIVSGGGQRNRAFTIQEMYNNKNKNDQLFGIEGYSPQSKYIDVNKIIKDREYFDMYKKPSKQRPKPVRPTRRGLYLDDIAKQVCTKAGPQTYRTEKDWVTKEMIEKGKKTYPKKDRNTYIDQIFKEQKLRHIPGVGKYNIIESLENMKKKNNELKTIKKSQGLKISYYDDFKFRSNSIPGPGQYNPHNIEKNEIVKIVTNKTNPEFWIKKHKTKNAKSVGPDVGTYKQNYPVEYKTFGKLLEESKEKKTTSKIWGTDERFHDPKKNKSNMVLNVPGPGQYQLLALWPGKMEGLKKDAKNKNWMDNFSKGINKSIYY